MAKQQHSLLNRGPGRSWPKALDEPRWVDDDPVDDPVETVAEVVVNRPPTKPAFVKKQDKEDDSLPSFIPSQVTVIIVNYKTRALLKRAYKSFRSFYPNVPMIIADNNSKDSSTDLVRELGTRPHVRTIIFPRNIGHGPAMNKAIQQADTPYIFTLDTDTETFKGGFLHKMVSRMKADNTLYALGWKRWVDRVSGVPKEWHTATPPPRKMVAYIHPSAGLYRSSMYHTLAPFFHHGAPCLDNMREADKRELKRQSFPVSDYIKHLKAGTRRMYNGRWDPTERTPKKKWKAKDNYPI